MRVASPASGILPAMAIPLSRRLERRLIAIAGLLALLVGPTLAQERIGTVTAADYARAEKFLAPAVNPLVVGGSVAANWMEDDRFWYRTTAADGSTRTFLVDGAKKTRTECTAAIAECPAAAARGLAVMPSGRGAGG